MSGRRSEEAAFHSAAGPERVEPVHVRWREELSLGGFACFDESGSAGAMLAVELQVTDAAPRTREDGPAWESGVRCRGRGGTRPAPKLNMRIAYAESASRMLGLHS